MRKQAASVTLPLPFSPHVSAKCCYTSAGESLQRQNDRKTTKMSESQRHIRVPVASLHWFIIHREKYRLFYCCSLSVAALCPFF